jgi:Leucine-rich repeat (LRR) protein
MPNLEILSLSHNKITSLRSFSHCGKLQELYLRKNAVSSCTQSQCARSRVRLGARMLCGYAARQLT